MQTGASVVGEAPIMDPEISPIPPVIFTGGQKVRNLASCLTSLNFEASAFENAARYLNSETNSVSRDDGRMSSPRLVKFGPRTPEILSWKRDPLKNFTVIMWQIVNNSATDCSILLKYYTEFEHITPKRPQKFKVKGSKVKVAARLDASKNLPKCE